MAVEVLEVRHHQEGGGVFRVEVVHRLQRLTAVKVDRLARVAGVDLPAEVVNLLLALEEDHQQAEAGVGERVEVEVEAKVWHPVKAELLQQVVLLSRRHHHQ